MTEASSGQRFSGFAGDFSGAFADLGTFLPLIIGIFAVQPLDPSGVLVGFGLFAIATALIYRRPIPVQPMKVVAAVVIGGGLGTQGVAATGLLLGLVLIVLVATGAVAGLARRVPDTVLAGVRLGVGLVLAWAGMRLVGGDWPMGFVALAGLLVLQFTRFKPLAALGVVVFATLWALWRGDANFPDLTLGLHWPSVVLPDVTGLLESAKTTILPQLALTLTNAALVTAAIAGDFFPADKARLTSGRLALSTGVLNLVLAPFGAFPMCHGAGGLVVQHKFGARTGVAPLVFGLTCLFLGIFLGAGALALLALVPMAAVGALLIIAGVELASSKSLREGDAGMLAVIIATGVLCMLVNVAVGFIAGLVLESARAYVERRGKLE